MTTKALVVGYGSIGQRHERLLVQLGCQVAVASRRPVGSDVAFRDIRDAVTAWSPDYVVLASRTSEHFGDLTALSDVGFTGRVLVEKPLFDRPRAIVAFPFSQIAVGYNLRKHPLLLRLKDFIGTQGKVVCAQIYVGQYLPQWRESRDYRDSYSAAREAGGGVLRDLSHELDYASWLFGPWERLTALGGHYSDLEIDTDDAFSILFSTHGCPLVQVHMNYLDRSPRREILVHTNKHSVRVDLVKQIFEIDGVAEPVVVAERDSTYIAEHVAMLRGDTNGICGLEGGMEVLRTIEAAERAASSGRWVTR